MMRTLLPTFVAALTALFLTTDVARACPFCSAVQVTFTEEIKTNDVAVIAALVERPKPSGESVGSDDLELLKAKFKVVDVLKGGKETKKGDTFLALYIGEAPIGKEFLVMGIEPPKVEWGAPIELSDRAKGYLHNLMKLPPKGPERLEFFQEHLEDKDPLISRDAYDEFATTPYAELKQLKSRMKHDMFLERLQDPKTDVSHRRLYLTMLGVCGTKDDLSLLEKMIKDEDRAMKAGLDALLGCYLTLKGAAGLPLVKELFIKNETAEFTDQYQAIMALRFHAEEGGVIKKDQIAEVLRHMLDRPKYADLVVADLARWGDWSVIDRMYVLFRDADQDSLWVREPVVNYMRACPLPKAKEYLQEFEKIDPKAVKRASGFFPLGPPKTSPVGDKPDAGAQRTSGKATDKPRTDKASAVIPRTFKSDQESPSPATGSTSAERNTNVGSQTLAEPVAHAQDRTPQRDAPGVALIVGTPLLVGLGVAAMAFCLSRGTNSGVGA
ncbi:MAG: hypothetical protein WD894_19280 [Pirellulales bacterium]